MPSLQPDDTRCCCERQQVAHVHRRDWRPCPATMHPPLRPSKRAAIWWYEFTEAVQREHTFRAFVREHPADFPRLGGGS